MKKEAKDEFKRYIEAAKSCRANRVYPLSIAEGFQPGDIFTFAPEAEGPVLFWHHCGFGYLSGPVTETVLDEIYAELFMKETPRRFVLISDDRGIAEYMTAKGLALSRRLEYAYDAASASAGRQRKAPPYRIERISEGNIGLIKGRITPSFSWDSPESFLEKGFGFAAFDGEEFCAVACSTAISSEEIDIGVETADAYRRKGLASYLSSLMCREILRLGKKPVWAHAESNKGSGNTALACGFAQTQLNYFIKRP